MWWETAKFGGNLFKSTQLGGGNNFQKSGGEKKTKLYILILVVGGLFQVNIFP